MFRKMIFGGSRIVEITSRDNEDKNFSVDGDGSSSNYDDLYLDVDFDL
jgi:hypothetical protein